MQSWTYLGRQRKLGTMLLDYLAKGKQDLLPECSKLSSLLCRGVQLQKNALSFLQQLNAGKRLAAPEKSFRIVCKFTCDLFPDQRHILHWAKQRKKHVLEQSRVLLRLSAHIFCT